MALGCGEGLAIEGRADGAAAGDGLNVDSPLLAQDASVNKTTKIKAKRLNLSTSLYYTMLLGNARCPACSG